MSIDPTVRAAITYARRQGARRAVLAMLGGALIATIGKNWKELIELIMGILQ